MPGIQTQAEHGRRGPGHQRVDFGGRLDVAGAVMMERRAHTRPVAYRRRDVFRAASERVPFGSR